MIDFFKDLATALKERATTPLLGTFGLLIFAFNWKGFFILAFGEMPALERLALFDQLALPDYQRFSVPLVVAIVGLIALPGLKVAIAWITSGAVQTAASISQGNIHAGRMAALDDQVELEQKAADLAEAQARRATANQRKAEANVAAETAIRDIADPDVQRQAKTDLQDAAKGPRRNPFAPPALDEMDLFLMKELFQSGNVVSMRDIIETVRSSEMAPPSAPDDVIMRKLETSFGYLESRGLVQQANVDSWILTTYGRDSWVSVYSARD